MQPWLTIAVEGAILGDQLPLHKCHAIRKLELATVVVETSTVPWEGPPVTTAPRYITEIIRSIPSQAFTTLILEFKGSVRQARHHLDLDEWQELDAMLLAHPTIREVEIRWEDSWNVEGIKHLMQYIFFSVFAGGKLRLRE
jgi:hypothetical protein